ncbi:MAG: LysM peptidoglycan-binding domain-containing protein [Phycisphaerales bacterium]
MGRLSHRMWIGLVSLAGVWIIAYWLTPAPTEPLVSTTDELRIAADRDERAEAEQPGPEPARITVIPRSANAAAEVDRTTHDNHDGASDDNPATTNDNNDSAAPRPGAIIPPSFQIYTVASGDTLSSIAESFYGTPRYAGQIARANPTVDPIRLRANTELKIPTDPRNIQGIPADPALQPVEPEPAFIEYVITRNDTLSEIAGAIYGRSSLWTHIRDANPQINRSGTNIRPGMTIRIPPPPE